MNDVDIYAPADKAVRLLNRDMLRAFGRLKTEKFDEVHIIRTVESVYREQAKKAKRRFYEVAFEAYLIGLFLCGVDGKKAHRMAEKAISPDWVEMLLDDVDLVARYRFNTETERKAQRLAETLEAASKGQSNLPEERVREAKEARGSRAGRSGSGAQDGGSGRSGAGAQGDSGRGSGQSGSGGASGGGGHRPGRPASVAPTTWTDLEIDRAVKAWSKQIGQFALSVTDAAVVQAYEDAEEPEVMWVSERDNRVCHECKELDGEVFPLRDVPTKPHMGCRCRLVPVRGGGGG